MLQKFSIELRSGEDGVSLLLCSKQPMTQRYSLQHEMGHCHVWRCFFYGRHSSSFWTMDERGQSQTQINLGNLCFVDYVFVTMLLGNKCYTVGKLVYYPFKCCHIWKEHAFVGWAVERTMWVAPMKNLPALLCQFQTTYSAIDSCLVFVELDD